MLETEQTLFAQTILRYKVEKAEHINVLRK